MHKYWLDDEVVVKVDNKLKNAFVKGVLSPAWTADDVPPPICSSREECDKFLEELENYPPLYEVEFSDGSGTKIVHESSLQKIAESK